MFPGPHSRVYRNEAGEPVGWDNDSGDDREAYWCDDCGCYHTGPCEFEVDDDTATLLGHSLLETYDPEEGAGL